MLKKLNYRYEQKFANPTNNLSIFAKKSRYSLGGKAITQMDNKKNCDFIKK